MLTFALIVAGTVFLSLGLLGAGSMWRRDGGPAVAVLHGWTAYLAVGAVAWFAKWPAKYVAPVALLMLLAGWWRLCRQRTWAEIFLAAIAAALAGALLAFPFLKHAGLLAYASWGTDQWGYIGVARWLVGHSVDQFPVIDNKPGRDWIWYVLTVRDRPLLYETLAVTSSALHLGAHIVYYILPAALTASVAQAFLLFELPAGVFARMGRLAVGLAVALQPSILLHLQYQFYGGVTAALIFMLLVVALFQARTTSEGGEPAFYAAAGCTGVLVAGLYTVKLTLLAAALTAATALTRLALGWPGWAGLKQGICSRRMLLAVVLAGFGTAALWRIRILMPEAWGAGSVNGQIGQVWVQFGAIFGLTDILPWYATDDVEGPLNPVRHNPAGGAVGVWLLGMLLPVCLWQCWRWFRQQRDVLPVLLFVAMVATALLAAPPRGSHWHISRVLPIIGPALLTGCAAAAWFGREARAARWLALGLACLPLLRAAPGLARHFSRPDCRMIAGEWKHPPDPFVWGALGYAYFYEEIEDIDWLKAPESFRAMTHYMPEEIRPRLKERKATEANAPPPGG